MTIRILFISFFMTLLFGGVMDARAQNLLAADSFEQKLRLTPGAQLLDVRTREEFSVGHIQGSVNIDYYNAAFRKRINKLDKSRPLFVYCRSGSRSAKAVAILLEEGFREIYELKGGILLWEKQYPVTVR